eukprot:7108446-Prymnesium_polylepis.1
MASEALWGAVAGKHSEGCSRELCEAKYSRAWRPTVSMLFSTRRSSGLSSITAFIEKTRCRAGGPGGQPVSMM